MNVSTSPAQNHQCRSTLSRRVDDLPASHQNSKDGWRTEIHDGSLKNQLTRLNTLLSHSLTLSRANLVVTISWIVLRSKDVIKWHSSGLEVFSGVGVASLDSSNFK